jgi:hypothetical protein
MKFTYLLVIFFCYFFSINAFSGINNPDSNKEIDNIFFKLMNISVRVYSGSFPEDLGIPENRKNEMIKDGLSFSVRRDTYMRELLKKGTKGNVKNFTLAYAEKREKETSDIIINAYESVMIEEHLQPLSHVEFTSKEHKTSADNLLDCAKFAKEYWNDLEFEIHEEIQKENLSDETWGSEEGKKRSERIINFINSIDEKIQKIETALGASDSSSCNNDTISTPPPHSECSGSVTTSQNHTDHKDPSSTLPYPPKDSDLMPKYEEYINQSNPHVNPRVSIYPPVGYLDRNPYQQNDHFIPEEGSDTVVPSAPPLEFID